MDVKFDLILLVDSNRVSNFFNQIVLNKTWEINKLISVDNCLEAIEFVEHKQAVHPIPDVIFLDLHAPLMNGWEFLDRYDQFPKSQAAMIVVMHTRELLEEEIDKLCAYDSVCAITNKSLDAKAIAEVYTKMNTCQKLIMSS